MSADEPMQDTGKVQAILAARARVLARSGAVAAPGATVELAVLALGTERYGVDIQHVIEVRPLGDLTAIPGAPIFWAGVENLRGTIYPVLDLATYLNLAPSQAAGGPGAAANDGHPALDKKVVLVSGAGLRIGLLVDDVPLVRQELLENIRPLLADAASAHHKILIGVTPDLLAVLDMEALLGDPRLIVQDEVA